MLLIRIVLVHLFLVSVAVIRGEDERPHRVPTGFIGVRGKKFYPQQQNFAQETNDGKEGRLDMRSPNEADKSAGYSFADYFKQLYGDSIENRKRKVPTGFIGVRGKKSVINRLPPSLRGRFIGVRGKKYDGLDYNLLDDQNYDDDKFLQLYYEDDWCDGSRRVNHDM